MVSRFSPAYLCLQETMLGDFTYSSPPGYRAFFSIPVPGQDHHGGTAIFIRSEVPFVPQQIHTRLQAVAVKVFLGSFYTLCSFYLPPGVPVVRPDLDDLDDLAVIWVEVKRGHQDWQALTARHRNSQNPHVSVPPSQHEQLLPPPDDVLHLPRVQRVPRRLGSSSTGEECRGPSTGAEVMTHDLKTTSHVLPYLGLPLANYDMKCPSFLFLSALSLINWT